MAKAKDNVKQVKLTKQEAKELKQRIQNDTLSDNDRVIFLALLSFNSWLQQQLGFAKLTIRKLKGLFGFSTEKKTLIKPPIQKKTKRMTLTP